MINGITFRDMIVSGANNIENQKQRINDLNVFPVPDGDTGTNMSATINAAKREIENSEEERISVVAEKTANALLKGARGNSGVILSLLFRGFAKEMAGLSEASAQDIARGFKTGVASAYKAVMKPTEGTMLTVARLSAEKCAEFVKESDDVKALLDTALKAAHDTLAKTPEMLPVLKQAGVVDSGGQGLCVIYEGMFGVLDGVKIEAETVKDEPKTTVSSRADFNEFGDEDIKFAYCTEFIINKNEKADAEKLKKFLYGIGDSVVCVDGGDIIKVHVHTNDPGAALSKAVLCGSMVNIKIDNMKQEREEMAENAPAENVKAEIVKEVGFVAVAAGDGIETVFCDLGVDIVVSGGQTMNPSTEDIIEAIDKTPASTVYVLPNNKNIVMAAEQAAAANDKNVIVIPTKNIPQGISVMLAYVEGNPEEENTTAMNEALGTVKSGSLTFAARDSVFDDKEIKEGQILGLCEGKITCVKDSVEEALCEVLETICDEDTAVVTMFYGSDVSDEDAEKISEMLQSKYDCDINVISGGQPVYYYIISAE